MTPAERARWLRLGGWILGIFAAIVAAYALRQVFAPFLLAIGLAYILEPPVRALHHQGLGRIWAILVVYAFVGLAIAAVVIFLVPQFLRELGHLTDRVPEFTASLADFARSWQNRYAAIPLPETVRSALDEGFSSLERRTLEAITGIFDGMFAMAAGAWSFVLVPFLAFYMLKDTDQFRRVLMTWIPFEAQPRWRGLMRDCDRVLSGFIRGQVIIAVLVGGAVALTAGMLGLPFALLLGMIAGLGEFVPYFGPIAGSLPAVLFAAGESPQTLLQLLMALIIIHQLEQALLIPMILSDSVGLHPLLVIFVLLTAGHFFGLVGMIIAVPLAGVLRSLWSFLVGPLQAGSV